VIVESFFLVVPHYNFLCMEMKNKITRIIFLILASISLIDVQANDSKSNCTFQIVSKNLTTGVLTISGFNHASYIYLAYSKNNWNTKDGWVDVTPVYTPGQDAFEIKLPEALRVYDGVVCDHFSGTLSCFSWDQSKQLLSKCDFNLSMMTTEQTDQYCDRFDASYDGTNIVLRGLNNHSVNNWIAQTTDNWKTFKDITPDLYQCKTQDTYYIPANKPLGVICMFAHSKMIDECLKVFDLSEFGDSKMVDRIVLIRKNGNDLHEIKTIKGNFDLGTTISIIDKFGKHIYLPQKLSSSEGMRIVLDSSIITSGFYTIIITSSKSSSISKISIK